MFLSVDEDLRDSSSPSYLGALISAPGESKLEKISVSPQPNWALGGTKKKPKQLNESKIYL